MNLKSAGLILTAALISNTSLWARSVTVRNVVDGDTIVVDGDMRVQLIGVDALGHSWGLRKSRELAKLSTEFATHFLKGKKVQLKRDPANDLKEHKDRWGRTLAYVQVGDISFNLAIIEQGYAAAYTKYPFELRREFKKAEVRAKAEGRGLWPLKEGAHSPQHAHKSREIYIGDKDSKVYHKASCLLVKNIPVKERIRFHEEEEARKSGFKQGRWCIPVLMKRFSFRKR